MKVAALLSMLHEQPGKPDSSTRKFRGEARWPGRSIALAELQIDLRIRP